MLSAHVQAIRTGSADTSSGARDMELDKSDHFVRLKQKKQLPGEAMRFLTSLFISLLLSNGPECATAAESSAPVQFADLAELETELLERARLERASKIAPLPKDWTGQTAYGGGENVATAVVISSLPFTDQGSTGGASDDYDESCPFVAPGSGDLVYAYTPIATDTVVVDLCASEYDTKVYVYVNSATPGNPYACNDDWCGDDRYKSRIAFMEVLADSTYYIVVDGFGGDAGSYTLEVLDWVDPLICGPTDVPEFEVCGDSTNDRHPGLGFGVIEAGTTVCGSLYADDGKRDNDYFRFAVTDSAGSTVTATALADPFDYMIALMDGRGEGLLDWDWSYGVRGAPTGWERHLDAGFYMIWVTYVRSGSNNEYEGFPCGGNELDAENGDWRYKLNLEMGSGSIQDACGDALRVHEGTYSFDLADMTPGLSQTGFTGPNAWYEYVATDCGIATLTATVSQGNPSSWGLAVYSACDSATEYVGYAQGADDTAIVSLPVVVGAWEGEWLVEVVSSGEPFVGGLNIKLDTLGIDCYPYNEGCDYPPEFLGFGDTLNHEFNNVGAQWVVYEDDYFDQGQFGADVWFTWTCENSGGVTLTTCESQPGFDTRVAVYEDTACLDTSPRQPIAADDDGCGVDSGLSYVEWEGTAGTSYLVRVGGTWDQHADHPHWPSIGVGTMSIAEGPLLPRPANDRCADVPPVELPTGTSMVLTGNSAEASNRDCLSIEPAVWEAFTVDELTDVTISFCGSVGKWDSAASHNLFADCPCYEAQQIESSEVKYDCGGGELPHKTLCFSEIPPGTYYFPVPGQLAAAAGDYRLTLTRHAPGLCLSCCSPPTVGDVDLSGIVDITDVSVLIDNQFLSLAPLLCEVEGDLDFSGTVDITDLSVLIDNQFLTLTPLPPCP